MGKFKIVFQRLQFSTPHWFRDINFFKNFISKSSNIRKLKKGSLTENNGTINNGQLLMVMEKFNFFKNLKNLLMGGHDEKLKNFGKSKKNH